MPGTVNRIAAVAILPLLVSAAGCRYDGSFMQMDSNAPFPFFGLQLSVDSGSRTPRHPPSRELHIPLGAPDLSTQGRAPQHPRSPQLKLVRLSQH